MIADDGSGEKAHWNQRYDMPDYLFGDQPNEFLRDHVDTLPTGRALVLAMGEGQDAVFLAKKGFEVEGCDIAPAAITKAKRLASTEGVAIKAFEADLEHYQLELAKFQLVTCFYYLQRDLVPQMKGALADGGMIAMETYTIDNQQLGFPGPRRAEHLLQENELLHLFGDLKVIVYRELILDDQKAVASIIAQKK